MTRYRCIGVLGVIDVVAILMATVHRLLRFRLQRGHVRFLCYHSVLPKNSNRWIPCGSIWADTFESHLRYLKESRIRIVSMPQAIAILSGKEVCSDRMVCITFDDGFRNNLTVAWPIIRRYGYTAHFFVTTDAIGGKKPYNWDLWTKGDQITDTPDAVSNNCLPLSENEIKVLSSEGATFGSHGMYHSDLIKLSDGELRREVRESRKKIQSLTGQQIDTFAYPFGLFNHKVIRTLRAENYQWGFSAKVGRNRPEASQKRYRINRVSFYKNGSLNYFKTIITGGYDFIRLKDIVFKPIE